jgi:hypothetical protein
VERLSTTKLTNEQIEALCDTAEQVARKFVLSKVSPKTAEELNRSIEAERAKPLNLNVELDGRLSKRSEDLDLQQLAKNATNEALKASESALRKLK